MQAWGHIPRLPPPVPLPPPASPTIWQSHHRSHPPPFKCEQSWHQFHLHNVIFLLGVRSTGSHMALRMAWLFHMAKHWKPHGFPDSQGWCQLWLYLKAGQARGEGGSRGQQCHLFHAAAPAPYWLPETPPPPGRYYAHALHAGALLGSTSGISRQEFWRVSVNADNTELDR